MQLRKLSDKLFFQSEHKARQQEKQAISLILKHLEENDRRRLYEIYAGVR